MLINVVYTNLFTGSVLSTEIGRQQNAIELMKRQGKVLEFNPLKKAA